MLAVIETHPIQYRAPVYRALANQLQVPLTVIYCKQLISHYLVDKAAVGIAQAYRLI